MTSINLIPPGTLTCSGKSQQSEDRLQMVDIALLQILVILKLSLTSNSLSLLQLRMILKNCQSNHILIFHALSPFFSQGLLFCLKHFFFFLCVFFFNVFVYGCLFRKKKTKKAGGCFKPIRPVLKESNSLGVALPYFQAGTTSISVPAVHHIHERLWKWSYNV